MCGRSACTLDPQTIKDSLHAQRWEKQDRYRQSFNVAPTRYQPVVLHDNGRMLRSMKWGYMGNNPQLSTINARAEGITSSPMWSQLLPGNRCAVVASGYFEWQTTGNKKQPHYLHAKDKPYIVMAGLYEEQIEENESDSVFHYTVITTQNSKDIGWLHDRMPVILDTDEKIDLWIGGDFFSQKQDILALLKPHEGLECYAVPELVNSNRNDSSDCIRKYEDFKKTGGIAAFFQGPKKEIKDEPTSSGGISERKKKEEEAKKKEEEKKKKPVGLNAYFSAKPKDEVKQEDVKDEKDATDSKSSQGDMGEVEDFKAEVKVKDEATEEETKVEEEANNEKDDEEAKDEVKQDQPVKVDVKEEEEGDAEVADSKAKEATKGGGMQLRKRKAPASAAEKSTSKKGKVSKK